MNRIFYITNSEKNYIQSIFNTVPYDPNGGESYINELRILAISALPRRIVDRLFWQRASLDPYPYLIFENLPTDDRIVTTPNPDSFEPKVKSGFISENLIMAFASLIGEPYSILIGEPYSMQFEGADIVNNLVPIKQAKTEYTGLESEVELDFHIENAALKFIQELNFSPMGLFLTGVRLDPQGPLTHLADAREALKLLSPETVATLREPLFCIKLPCRWRRGNLTQTAPIAMVQGNLDVPEISAVFYPDMIEPQTNSAVIAMKNFYEAIRKVSFSIEISPGRLVYIDNRFTLHSRDKFRSMIDEYGNPMRWIQRVFVAPNLWNHRSLSAVKDRVFETIGG